MRLLLLALLLLLWQVSPLGGEEVAAPSPAATDKDAVDCPNCAGTGRVPCPRHCVHGKVRCPENCLKADDPRWHPKEVPGQSSDLLWIDFPPAKGTVGGFSISNKHIGDLILYDHGMPKNRGPCPTCAGTGLVPCKTCGGKGDVICPICKGATSSMGEPSMAGSSAAPRRRCSSRPRTARACM
jgi:hypothetical protein